jgi:hypothetical protein
MPIKCEKIDDVEDVEDKENGEESRIWFEDLEEAIDGSIQ